MQNSLTHYITVASNLTNPYKTIVKKQIIKKDIEQKPCGVAVFSLTSFFFLERYLKNVAVVEWQADYMYVYMWLLPRWVYIYFI